MTVQTDKIHWLGHDSFLLDLAGRIYIDPWEIDGPTADIILITHDHFDHCDPAAVKKLSGPQTLVLTEANSAAKVREAGFAGQVTVVEPGEKLEVKGAVIEALPAYNVDKDFHPKAKKYLGFIVRADGLSVYHAGDSDFIPEMNDLAPDIALLPVSGTYVMTAEQAVEAALAVKAKISIPMHYGKIVGDRVMAESFQKALAGRLQVELKEVESL